MCRDGVVVRLSGLSEAKEGSQSVTELHGLSLPLCVGK